jgi:YidC/Oxa1 family membrane protein insertase
MVLHEGPVGYLDDKLREVKYEDLDKEGTQTFVTKSGWLGITDKYWLAALIPDQKVNVKASYKAIDSREGKIYQADFIEPVAKIEPGRSITTTSRLFAGAKSLQLLDDYESINNNYTLQDMNNGLSLYWYEKRLFLVVNKNTYTIIKVKETDVIKITYPIHDYDDVVKEINTYI